jgi:polyvinyl alcohol dehydrogenase (cytochrome)
MFVRVSRLVVGVAAVALSALLAGAPTARADWTTYHGDGARSGVDSSSTGPVPFASAWTSPVLGGDVYAEPLIYKGLVLVATEGNDIYGLNESTGQVAWRANAGTPVPDGSLPCGDISPTVGITSTPVIDPASDTLFVVADLLQGGGPHHWLIAYNARTGTELWREPVDPAGATPATQLQRAALNLAGGRVLIGFGGNAGDCGSYWGWLLSVSEATPHAISTWQAPTSKGDAIWAAGGPAVDGAGNVYAATGNGASSSNTNYDDGDSLIKFGSAAKPLDSFAPTSWASDSVGDADLGSASPELLSGGLVYQDGKNGNGYLVSTAHLGGVGGQLYTEAVCDSFGADAYRAGVLYVACSDGIRALSINGAARTFSPLWHGPSDANGPPIIAGGLVWVAAWDNATLYGLDPSTGQTVVTSSTPAMEHFTSPSASDGKLFLATGQTVQAYAIAEPAPSPTVPPPPPAAAGSPVLPTCGCHGKRCETRLALVIPRHARLVRARVYLGLGRKLLATRRGHRLRRISFRSPRHRTSFSIRVVEITSRHRRHTYTVRFRNCHPIRDRRRG